MNGKNNNRVLRAGSTINQPDATFTGTDFKSDDSNQRFYLRKECIQTLRAHPEETRNAYYNRFEKQTVTTN